ncbi:LPS export ABC transporter ATP-binding protein [bacterium]|nr:LPS export ABC transporter ATP-binding protein [bacterium]
MSGDFTPPADAVLYTEKLVKTYNQRNVVKGVSIHVNKGEIVGLLGPNGAGKTTTFYMIVGIIRPNQGRVVFQGRDITNDPMCDRAQHGIAYLAQEPSVFRRMTSFENIMAIMETLPMKRDEMKKRSYELLEELGISKLAKSKAYTLSGGERRRLEIARALVTSPSLILLDEPFSGVDPIAVADVQQIIRELKHRDLAILITDHNVRETLSVTDRAYLINQGEILIEGSADKLINDPEARRIYLGEDFKI